MCQTALTPITDTLDDSPAPNDPVTSWEVSESGSSRAVLDTTP
jgi:hypothetical protein